MAAHYQNFRVGYPSRPRIQYAKRMGGDYDHLARVKEWAAGEAEGDGE
jgi:ATP-dependent helicase/nuclease subunit B